MMDILTKGKTLCCDETIEPPEFLGGLFPQGQISVVAAKPGTGKTWLMLGKVYGLAMDGVKTLILNGETGMDILTQRVTALKWDYPGDSVRVLNGVDCLDVGGLNLDEETGWRNVVEYVDAFQPDIVWIDSLIAFVNSDESDMKSIRAVFMRLKALAEKRNCAVVVNHHLRKKSGNASAGVGDIGIDDVIGSSAISRIACCVFLLTQEGDGMTRCACAKSWFVKPKAFTFQIVNDVDGLGGVTFKSSMGVATLSVRETLKKLMNLDRNWRTAKYVANLTKIPVRTVQYHLQRMSEMGELQRKRIEGAGNGLAFAYGSNALSADDSAIELE